MVSLNCVHVNYCIAVVSRTYLSEISSLLARYHNFAGYIEDVFKQNLAIPNVAWLGSDLQVLAAFSDTQFKGVLNEQP
jgi:hypothetical protein